MELNEYKSMNSHDRSMWWYLALHERLIERIYNEEGILIDAGCGTGGFLSALKKKNCNTVAYGLELSRYAAIQAVNKSGCPVIRGTVNKTPFKSKSIDVVVSSDVIAHRAVQVDQFLSEVQRILKPGGKIIINAPAHNWLMSEHDRRVHNGRRFSRSELRNLLVSHGFTAVDVTYWNILLFPIMIAKRIFGQISASKDSEVAYHPSWMNSLFKSITRLERHLPIGSLPGGSLLATARTPRDNQAQ